MTERVTFSIAEVAEMLGVPESTVRTWTATGVLGCYRIHERGKRGRVLIAAKDVDELLARSRVSGRAS
jgi:excisionase family DNA binding protein